MTQAFDPATLAADYWSTSIIDIHPDRSTSVAFRFRS